MKITWTNTQKKARNMGRLARKVERVHVPRWGEQVGIAGKESVHQSVVDGGINKTKKGGSRILTGDMFDSAGSKVTAAGGSATVRAGFINDVPPQAIWQERGTLGRRVDSRNPRLTPNTKKGSGIPAMLAIPEAIVAMDIQADVSGNKMLVDIAREWDTRV